MRLPQLGEIFDDFQVLERLGKGGMGLVFLAQDLKLERKVALKFLSTENGRAMDPKYLVRFENEAKILASLNNSHIVKVFSFGKYENMSYLVMEYIEGVTLSHIIKAKSFGVIDCIKLVQQILQGLQQAHNKGILHRDVKPANLIVNEDNEAKIVDFGISCNLFHEGPDITQDNFIVGTLGYMAPELFMGQPATASSDIFALGIVFFELLTGKNAFSGKTNMEVADKIRRQQLVLPEPIKQLLPSGLDEIFTKMISIDRNDRYQSCEAVLADIEKLDISSLPIFHNISLGLDINIVNRPFLTVLLEEKGYYPEERDIIIKMAAKMQEVESNLASVDADSTIEVGDETASSAVYIEEAYIDKAIIDFEEIKKRHTTDGIKVLNFSKIASAEKAHFEAQSAKGYLSHPQSPMGSSEVSVKKGKSIIGAVIKVSVLGVFLLFSAFGLLLANLDFSSQFISDVVDDQGKTQGSDLFRVPAQLVSGLTDNSPIKREDRPTSKKRALVPGTKMKVQQQKFDLHTGQYLYRKTDSIEVIKTLAGDKVKVLVKDGKTKKTSWQILSNNAFLPPLRWVAKGQFDISISPNRDIASVYPVHVGKSFTYSYKTIQNGQAFLPTNKKCHATEVDEVFIGAKDLTVIKVDCNYKAQGASIQSTSFYSAKWDMVVKKSEIETVGDRQFQKDYMIKSISFPKGKSPQH